MERGNSQYDPGALGPDFRQRVERLPRILEEAAFRAIDSYEHLAEPEPIKRLEFPVSQTSSEVPGFMSPEEIDWGVPHADYHDGVL